jgi:phosphate transport system permease protein
MSGRRLKDRLAGRFLHGAAGTVNLLMALIGLGLLIKAWPVLRRVPLADLFWSTSWRPLKGQFGFSPFIAGTVSVTLLAMCLAVPACLLSAIYLSEYAPRRVRNAFRLVMDILAGVPSVIYGVWGMLTVVPLVRELGRLAGHDTTGFSLLAGGVVLAIMVMPVIVSVSLEVFHAVPLHAREAALALGATRWEMVRHVLLRRSARGVVAAVGLGFARAFGETMAVLMVVGNVARVPGSLFDPVYPLPALIANNYGEMMSIPLYDAALMLAALILLVVVTGFNLLAHLTLARLEKGWA